MPRCGLLLVAVSAGVLALHPAVIQAKEPVPAETVVTLPASEETGKERLSDKASDEQRVDNCKVPPDRQGTKPRPSDCPQPLHKVPTN
jgi:hypothetical protein